MEPRVTSGTPPSAFLFVTCQVGAEAALKSELARRWADFHFAYSRPGFLTFKLPPHHALPADFDLHSVFARAYGFSLGKTTSEDLHQRAQQVWQLAGDAAYDAIHVWQRDTAVPGFRGFEPGTTRRAAEAEVAIMACALGASAQSTAAEQIAPYTRIASPGQQVLDCILVEPGEWWIGTHRALGGPSCLPGGVPEISLPPDAVSRAYLKMEEALAWSGLPIRAGERVAEIGCAPGGASQALLGARNVRRPGIDPAQVDPRVLANPRFTHIRKRGADVRRRDFRNVPWLAVDMNVAPDTTLETVEAIVTHSAVNVRGLLLTLKLIEWDMAAEIPRYVERVRGWGYADVQARQLAFNRQEICIAARRTPRRKSSKHTAR